MTTARERAEAKARELLEQHFRWDLHGEPELVKAATDFLEAARNEALEDAAKYHDDIAKKFKATAGNDRIASRFRASHRQGAIRHEQDAAAIRAMKEPT